LIMRMNRDLRKIEKRLQNTLTPVEPRHSFVSQLEEQLTLEMGKKAKVKKVRKGILVAGGVLGGVVMTVTIIRTLTSREGLSETLPAWFSRQKEEHQTATA